MFLKSFLKSDPRVTRTPNLLIWSQTRYHCAIWPHIGLALDRWFCDFSHSNPKSNNHFTPRIKCFFNFFLHFRSLRNNMEGVTGSYFRYTHFTFFLTWPNTIWLFTQYANNITIYLFLLYKDKKGIT